jgi:tryptophanyl-tRNA synthetase
MEKVVSGVRPTGNLHLGNYFGAVKSFIQMQEKYNCFFFVADYHRLTTHLYNQQALHESVYQIVAEYLACGLDPEKCTLYVQSDLPETSELYLILNMLAYKGELEKCTTFKDKVRKNDTNVNAGLLTYPVLMAADILIHKAVKVPVGKDQEQHLEMTRNFAKRFNHHFKTNLFPEPEAFNFSEKLTKVPGLDGAGKMGKSEGPNNAIYLYEDESVIRKKVMKAKTDAGPTENNSPLTEEVKNLFQLMDLVSTQDKIDFFKESYANCNIRYGDLKKSLAEDIIAFTFPIKEKIKEYSQDKEYIKRILNLGRDKARESAHETLQDVRSLIGFIS